MHADAPLINIIALGFGFAYVFGMISNFFKLSPLVGYLIAGVLLGPHVPFIYDADLELANELSEIGVILLMFGVGLHFSLNDLNSVKNIAVPGAVLQIAGTIIAVMFAGVYFGYSIFESIIFGLCLSVASTVVLLRQLEDFKVLETPRGKVAVGWLIVEDLITVVVLVLLPTLQFMTTGEAFNFKQFSLDMITTAVKVVGFAAVMMYFGRKIIPTLIAKSAATGSRELFTLSVLGIALGVAYLAVTVFNVSYALGAFFAGMIMHESELSHRAAEETLPLRDAFAVLFFVSVGMLFDYRIIITNTSNVIITTLMIIGLKSIICFVILKLMGKFTRMALTISISLAQIGEFSFILAGLAVQYGYLQPIQKDYILAGAIISIIANPFLFAGMEKLLHYLDESARKRMNNLHEEGIYYRDFGHQNKHGFFRLMFRKSLELCRLKKAAESAPNTVESESPETTVSASASHGYTTLNSAETSSGVDLVTEQPLTVETKSSESEMLGEGVEGASSIIPLTEEELMNSIEGETDYLNTQIHMVNHHIVVGFDSVGKQLATRLQRLGKAVVVITNNYEELTEINAKGLHSIFGDFKDLENLELANVAHAGSIIFAIIAPYEIGYTIDAVYEKYPELWQTPQFKVSALASHKHEVEFLHQHHVDNVIAIRDVAASILLASQLNDADYSKELAQEFMSYSQLKSEGDHELAETKTE